MSLYHVDTNRLDGLIIGVASQSGLGPMSDFAYYTQTVKAETDEIACSKTSTTYGFNFISSQNPNSNADLFGAKLNNGYIFITNCAKFHKNGAFYSYPLNQKVSIGDGQYKIKVVNVTNDPNNDKSTMLNKLSASERKKLFPSINYSSSTVYPAIAFVNNYKGTSNYHKFNNFATYYYEILTGNTNYTTNISSSYYNLYVAFLLEPVNAPVLTLTDVNDVLLAPTYVGVTSPVSATATVYVDDQQVSTFQLQANAQTDLNMASFWSEISSYETHTIKIKATANGITCEDKFTFTKKDAGLSVMGKSVSVNNKPIACTVLSIVDHAEGEEASFYVTNNGNDTKPTWEKYTGDSHYFSNETKSSEKWGVNWRYEVDASEATGSTQPAIKGKVAMGVIYDEANSTG